MKYGLLLMVIMFGIVSGCDNKPKNQPPPPQAPQMIKEEKKVLDSAKGVDDTISKQAEEQRKQIEEATK